MELPTRYDPAASRERWYSYWEKHDLFHARLDSGKKPYSIVIPPPNVTGRLHIGHALNNTLQDVLCRWRRMEGDEVLWMPGTDHAGIATQNVVEKELHTQGLSRHDLGREKLVERIWKWKEEYGGTIIRQLRYMGCSCDWPRERFTMDEGLSAAVREVFVRLYHEGFIYRDTYLVNWCPRCRTALSDDEVEYVDERGALYYVRYPYADGTGSLTIATTRPETMLGDTGVAIHPDDERYSGIAGREVILPLLERRIPVIADAYVDRKFGTGALKVTPAHDINDFEIGRRHGLERVNIFNPDASINENGGPYAGLDRNEARKKVIEDLEAQGLIEKVDDFQHRVGVCYRCETFIEPFLSLQWFVKMKPLMEEPLEAVRDGRTVFIPKMWERTFFSWVENVRDWCISRQIWWGHRIPVWYCEDCNGETVTVEDPSKCSHCGSEKIRQDPDVLDTWFSSALWPFSTMGWPEKTPELEMFYPTSVLVTAHDIIYFWVARMMMMGLHFMKEVPFGEVYITALVRDAQGRKMSKSLGNAIDPIDVIDKHGVDAMRFTLSIMAAQGRNINLAEERIEGYRNFTNKIWNAARLILSTVDSSECAEDSDVSNSAIRNPKSALGWPDRWILSRLQHTIQATVKGMREYKFNDAAEAVYQFVWHEYCDWYLELIKRRLYGSEPVAKSAAQHTALSVLEAALRLMHPFIPFITEELWQMLKKTGCVSQPGIPSIMAAEYPKPDTALIDDALESESALFQKVVYTIRNIRGELGISPAAQTEIEFLVRESQQEQIILQYWDDMRQLCNVNEQHRVYHEWKENPASSSGLVDGIEIRLAWPEEVREKESARLEKLLAKTDQDVQRRRGKLGNEQFVKKAPAEVVERERAALATAEEELALVQRKVEALKTSL
ncbi:MAG: valine--tRNA ligase [bacterium]